MGVLDGRAGQVTHSQWQVFARWHDHGGWAECPAVSLSIYSDAKAAELRAAGEALFG